MVSLQIPNLVMAHSEPGHSEPTKFGEHVIAKEFNSFFKFKDGKKTWLTCFSIEITELGTPKLKSVTIQGSVATHPKPLAGRIIDSTNKDEVIESLTLTGKLPPIHSDEEIEERIQLAPKPESVQRWQLKIVEQYRFQLLELAIRLAIELGHPSKMKTPDGGFQIMWDPREPFNASEIKALLNDIDKKIRQKITPDFLAEVAGIYTEAGLRGERPIKAIQEFYKCSYRTAQDYATKAREIKLLPETTPGKITVRKTRAREE